MNHVLQLLARAKLLALTIEGASHREKGHKCAFIVNHRRPDFARFGMRRNNVADLVNAVDPIEVISTEVFDSLLLRTGRSERSWIPKGERLFSEPAGLRATAAFCLGASPAPANRDGDALFLAKAESNLIAAECGATRVTGHFTKPGH